MKFYVALFFSISLLFGCKEKEVQSTSPIDTVPAAFQSDNTGLMPVAIITLYAEGESREVVYGETVVYDRNIFESDCEVLTFLGERWQNFCDSAEMEKIWNKRELYTPKKRVPETITKL